MQSSLIEEAFVGNKVNVFFLSYLYLSIYRSIYLSIYIKGSANNFAASFSHEAVLRRIFENCINCVTL